MANNDISTSFQNNSNRNSALKKLDELRLKAKSMIHTTEEVVIDGKKSIVERYTHVKKKKK